MNFRYLGMLKLTIPHREEAQRKGVLAASFSVLMNSSKK